MWFKKKKGKASMPPQDEPAPCVEPKPDQQVQLEPDADKLNSQQDKDE